MCNTKNEASCRYVAQKVKMLTDRKLWAEMCVGQDPHFQPILIEGECNWVSAIERVQDEKLVYCITLQVSFNHIKNDSFLTEFHCF